MQGVFPKYSPVSVPLFRFESGKLGEISRKSCASPDQKCQVLHMSDSKTSRRADPPGTRIPGGPPIGLAGVPEGSQIRGVPGDLVQGVGFRGPEFEDSGVPPEPRILDPGIRPPGRDPPGPPESGTPPGPRPDPSGGPPESGSPEGPPQVPKSGPPGDPKFGTPGDPKFGTPRDPGIGTPRDPRIGPRLPRKYSPLTENTKNVKSTPETPKSDPKQKKSNRVLPEKTLKVTKVPKRSHFYPKKWHFWADLSLLALFREISM